MSRKRSRGSGRSSLTPKNYEQIKTAAFSVFPGEPISSNKTFTGSKEANTRICGLDYSGERRFLRLYWFQEGKDESLTLVVQTDESKKRSTEHYTFMKTNQRKERVFGNLILNSVEPELYIVGGEIVSIPEKTDTSSRVRAADVPSLIARLAIFTEHPDDAMVHTRYASMPE